MTQHRSAWERARDAVVKRRIRGGGWHHLLESLDIRRPEADVADWSGKPMKGVLHGAAGSVDITPPLGRMLIGYGPSPPRVASGVWSPLRATVLCLQTREGEAASEPLVVLVHIDLMTGSRWITERVARLVSDAGVRLHPATLWLMPGHTHHAPGGVFASYFVDNLPSPSQGFDLDLCETIARQLAAEIVRCQGAMVPVRLAAGQASARGLHWQRSEPAFRRNDTAVQEKMFEHIWGKQAADHLKSHGVTPSSPADDDAAWEPDRGLGHWRNYWRVNPWVRGLCLFAAAPTKPADKRPEPDDAVEGSHGSSGAPPSPQLDTLVGAIFFANATPSAFTVASARQSQPGTQDPARWGRDLYSADVFGAAADLLRGQEWPHAPMGVAAGAAFGDVNVVHPTLSVNDFRRVRAATAHRIPVEGTSPVPVEGTSPGSARPPARDGGPRRDTIDGHAWLDVADEITRALALTLREVVHAAACPHHTGHLMQASGHVQVHHAFHEAVIAGARIPVPAVTALDGTRRLGAAEVARRPLPGISMLSASELNTSMAAGSVGTLGVPEGLRRALNTGRHGRKPRTLGVFDAVLEGMNAPQTACLPPFWPLRMLRLVQVNGDGAATGTPLHLGGLPAEPGTLVASDLMRDLGECSQFSEAREAVAIIAGNTGDYQGYITSRREYSSQQYEGAATYWGRWTATWCRWWMKRLMALDGPGSLATPALTRRGDHGKLRTRATRLEKRQTVTPPEPWASFACNLLAWQPPPQPDQDRTLTPILFQAQLRQVRRVETRPEDPLEGIWTTHLQARSRFRIEGSVESLLLSVWWAQPADLIALMPHAVDLQVEVRTDKDAPWKPLRWMNMRGDPSHPVETSRCSPLRWCEEVGPDPTQPEGMATSVFLRLTALPGWRLATDDGPLDPDPPWEVRVVAESKRHLRVQGVSSEPLPLVRT